MGSYETSIRAEYTLVNGTLHKANINLRSLLSVFSRSQSNDSEKTGEEEEKRREAEGEEQKVGSRSN